MRFDLIHKFRFPLPEQICAYGDRKAFNQSRKEAGQWVFWQDRVELILAGKYNEVHPLHVELSPTYLCNFACSWCSCRAVREDWLEDDVFHHPKATPQTVMEWEKINQILHHLARYRVGIMWVGGEPTMNNMLYPATLQAHKLGLQQCLFTNGSLLNDKRIETLLEAELVFIRVSLDSVTDKIHRIYHGYCQERNYAQRVKDNLVRLISRRIESKAKTLVSVSIVIDERNLDDIIPTAFFLRSLCERFGTKAIDYVIIRPTYQFDLSEVQLSDDTGSRLYELVNMGANVRKILEQCKINVITPKESYIEPKTVTLPDTYNQCLACGWFGEVTPNGDMVICSDMYGNPDYFIGNLAEKTIDELWKGQTRQNVLDFVERTSCLKKRCPRNGRGFHLNRIFHEIERFRREGRIDEVYQWINDLRQILPKPSHPFFL